MKPDSPQDQITVFGARENNLVDVDVRLPRNQIVVFTGLSGSGKSSLAFQTIYQEGQRRFLESLSSYARQFLGSMERPAVDRVDGLSPTLCIDQKTVSRNPRSTVGTVTEILDHLRLWMARLGTPHCPVCMKPLATSSPEQIADLVLQKHEDARLHILAPIVQDRKGEYRKELAQALAEGFIRARIDGEIIELDGQISLARYEKHTIELVVDRIKARPDRKERLVEAIERSLALADGQMSMLIQLPDHQPEHRVFSSSRTCPEHGISVPELEPRLFSFNAPQGACATCNGIGWLEDFDFSLAIDPEASVRTAVQPLTDARLPFTSVSRSVLCEVAKQMGIDPTTQWKALTKKQEQALLFGADIQYTVTRERAARTVTSEVTWAGIAPALRHAWKWGKLKRLEPYRRRQQCKDCLGTRLNPVSRAVRYEGHSIAQLSAMTVDEAHIFFSQVHLSEYESQIGTPILREIQARLDFLRHVGLNYLQIDRSAATLSGGEAQRIRLASQVGSGLQGVTYVLDEPSIGLHGRDQTRLLEALVALRDRGNSVLVVEHDTETILAADYVLEVGPGAGREGGRIVGAGTLDQFMTTDALTARYLRGERSIDIPSQRRKTSGPAITLYGAAENNLKSIDFRLPLGTFTVVTGVSGSGKSSLVETTLTRVLRQHLHNSEDAPGDYHHLEGVDQIDKIIPITQAPIGRTPRSNPATYTNVMNPIRDLFAQVPEARVRGYTKSRFSFNVAGGRCEACNGAGYNRVEMQFLADVEVPCEACGTRRFNAQTLEIRYRGRNIADVLEMTVAEARAFFSKHRKINKILETLVAVGLGYVQLGQPSTTLSGGEAQRIKLASELARPGTGRTLYVLDEPTTGLHMEDVSRLVDALQALVNAGNTVLVIEHNTDVMKVADHIVDLGPEGGEGGGQIVGIGTPEHIASLQTPTGRVLHQAMQVTPIHPTTAPPIRTKADADFLHLKGVQTHNLRDVHLSIPHGKLSVVTGPSGSGKTSLAFHTLFSEGQRRYVESLSTYARRFLGRMGRAPVDQVEGLAPAIAIDQRSRGHNPRSTVSTVTEIYDALRLLYAHIGQAHCPQCNTALISWSPSRAAIELAKANPGVGWLLAALPDGCSPADLIAEGFSRVFLHDKEQRLDDLVAQQIDCLQEAELVIDRLNPGTVELERVSEAVELAYGWGNERGRFLPRSGEAPIVFSRGADCPEHGVVLHEALTPRHFSFNSHIGACPACTGLGKRMGIDEEVLLPFPDRELRQALDKRVASVLYRSPRTAALIQAIFDQEDCPSAMPVCEWPPSLRQALLHGVPLPVEIEYHRSWGRTKSQVTEQREWNGICGIVEGWQGENKWIRRTIPCTTCQGSRLRPEVRSTTISGARIDEITAFTIQQALDFWQNVPLNEAESIIAAQPVRELRDRLQFLCDVGLDYLTLNRTAQTLSGGEAQRIRLATQLGSRLTGTIYVLDEPTIGLHDRDTERLLTTLHGLRDLGNTLVVVEHDLQVIRAADFVVDMGPGSGEHGGQIVAQGTPNAVEQTDTLTGQFLSGHRRIPIPPKRRKPPGWLKLPAVHRHNLTGFKPRFPRACMTVVTGVSGSGKSSLVMGELVPWLETHIQQKKPGPQRLVVVDQNPIGRTPRSAPATYCDLMGPIRKLLAATPLARSRGWGPARFSYNHKESGRCVHCEGRGAILIEMHFLSDVWMTCDFCKGLRFNGPTLEIRWKGKNIAEILQLTVDQALTHFSAQRSIARRLQALHDVGLGYIRLGQSATTLSGGEAQRMKLAKELQSPKKETCFVLDEPTTGLHMDDIDKLLVVLHRLVDAGHMVVMIEHQIDVIRSADHVMDIGPEGGSGGGQLIASGPPEKLTQHPNSWTGRALAKSL